MKLIHGDCLEELPKLDSNSIDLVLVDLPYGELNKQGCPWDVKIDLSKMWEQLKRICKDNTAYIFFTTAKFGCDLINSNPTWFKYDLVWKKTNIGGFLMANRRPMRQHEQIYVFYKKQCTYNPQKTDLDNVKTRIYKKPCEGAYGKVDREFTSTNKGKYPTSILEYSNPNNNRLHHTQKPVELCEWLIKTYSNEDDIVLDFTMGSASTGIACINTNRGFIGIEKDDEIFKVAEKRIKEFVANK